MLFLAHETHELWYIKLLKNSSRVQKIVSIAGRYRLRMDLIVYYSEQLLLVVWWCPKTWMPLSDFFGFQLDRLTFCAPGTHLWRDAQRTTFVQSVSTEKTVKRKNLLNLALPVVIERKFAALSQHGLVHAEHLGPGSCSHCGKHEQLCSLNPCFATVVHTV